MVNRTTYLVRHGITRSNIENIYAGWSEEELTEEGIAQVNKLGKEMQKCCISAIYTSSIRRAVQTAEFLNEFIKGEIIIEPDLKEMKMGPWERLSEHEIENKYPKEYKIWLERPADLMIHRRETLHKVQLRAVKAINKILKRYSERISLCVTHVAIIRCIFLYFNQLPLNSYKKIDVPNASVHKLVLNNDKIIIKKTR